MSSSMMKLELRTMRFVTRKNFFSPSFVILVTDKPPQSARLKGADVLIAPLIANLAVLGIFFWGQWKGWRSLGLRNMHRSY